MRVSVEYHITQYELEQGALEIQYIEEYFGEFPRKKTAAEIVGRLEGRSHLILLATAPLTDDPGTVVPVSFKVAHEVKVPETVPKLADLVHRLSDNVQFAGRRVLYTWIGGTRRDWRGQGFFRALTEQQELWAIEHGFDEIVVKTKNRRTTCAARSTTCGSRSCATNATAPTTPSRRCTSEAPAGDDFQAPEQESRHSKPV
jgi:hypothetical protein